MVPYPNDLFQQFFHGLPQHFFIPQNPTDLQFFWGVKTYSNCSQKPSTAHIEATASSVKRCVDASQGKPAEDPGTVHRHAERDFQKLFTEMGLSIPIPIQSFEHHIVDPDAKQVTTYHIRPQDWVKHWLDSCPELLGGCNGSPAQNLNHSGGCMSSSTQGMRFTMLTEIIWKMFCRWQSMAMRDAPSRKLTTLWLVLNLYLGLLKIPVSMLVAHANLFWHQDRIFLATGRSRKSRMMSLHNMPENNLQILKVTRIFLVGSSLG